MGVKKINSPGYEIPDELENIVAITTFDKIYNWGRSASVWPIDVRPSVLWHRIYMCPSKSL